MGRRGPQSRWKAERRRKVSSIKLFVGSQADLSRKVGQVIFHPTAQNVLTSASGDHLVKIWDIDQGDSPKITLKGHNDTIQSLAWNAVGTTLATVSFLTNDLDSS